jgi:RHS repeat-associated protein
LEPIDREIDALGERFWSKMMRDFTCVGINGENLNMDRQLPAIDNLLKRDDTEHDLYFYHGDHLGSSSYITDINGDATQHMQYLPFGEDFIHEQNATSYYTPYTFSAKEKDIETGYSYFGARYYSPELSIWLSVDPMAHKLPAWSSYNYCLANPVKLKDPDGKFPLLTAVIGGVVGAVSEGVSSYMSNRAQGMSSSQAFRNIDRADVLIATAEGVAIGVGAGPIAAKALGALLKSSIDNTADGGTQTLGGVVGDKKDSKAFGIDLGSNLMGGSLERTGLGKFLGQKLSGNKFLSNLFGGASEGAATGAIEGGLKNFESSKGTSGIVSGGQNDINSDGTIKAGAVVNATRELPTVEVH